MIVTATMWMIIGDKKTSNVKQGTEDPENKACCQISSSALLSVIYSN
jgi:hypothetical protein